MQIISANNNSTQVVLTNELVNLGTTSRRFQSGYCAQIYTFNGTSITINIPGMYNIILTATFTAPAPGDVTLQLEENGVAAPGAFSTESITTAATETRSLTLIYTSLVDQSKILNQVFTSPKTITIRNTGVGATLSNVSIRIVKAV